MDGKPTGPDVRTMVEDLSRVGSIPGSRGGLLLPGMTAILPRERGSRTKTAIIATLAVSVLAIGGGSFYYFQIYLPAQYARAVIGIYDSAIAKGSSAGTAAASDAADYAGALEAIRSQRLLAERVRSELASLDPPAAMASISKTFEEFLELNLASLADTEPKAEFFKVAAELQAEMKKFTAVINPGTQPAGAGPARPPSAPTAGAVREVWEVTVPRMQSLGETLFTKEIIGLSDPNYAELKAAWEKAGSGLPFLLGIIRKIHPRAGINTVPENLSKAELDRAETAFADVGKFSELLSNALAKASALDLLSFRQFPRQAELSERTFKLMQTIDGLRRDYGP